MRPRHPLAIFTVLAALVCAARPAAPRDALTVATYNVENLFDAHDDPYTSDEETVLRPDTERRALARAIDLLDADILGLQEIESRGVLETFNEVKLAKPYPRVVLLEGNDPRGIDVALLTRLPVLSATSHRHRRLAAAEGAPGVRFARDLLEVRLALTEKEDLTVFVCHLLSGLDDADRQALRQQEAQLARAIIDERMASNPGARVLLLGDANDRPGSRTVRTLLGEGDSALFDLPLPADAWTHRFKDRKVRLDILFMSQAMKARLVPGSARVVTGKELEAASDHLPVTASFRLAAGEAPGGAPFTSEPLASGSDLPYRTLQGDDPLCREALDATALERLAALTGKAVTVKGRLHRVSPAPSGGLYFLDLARNYRKAISVVVFSKSLQKFPGLDLLEGRTVLVNGTVTTHKERPQIVLEEPSQLMLGCGASR